jgi:hypothetical protein
MALMAAAGEIKPMPMAAVFADTQAEPPSVYRWLDWLEKQLPFPVCRVTAGNLREILTTSKPRKDGLGYWQKSSLPAYTLNYDGSKGHMPRGCTYDFKVIPLTRAARKLGGITRGQKTVGIVQWIGISCDEAHRMKPPREPWIEHRWPLIEAGMSRVHCLRWMKMRNYPEPPRSACTFCPYHNDREWLRLRTEEPDAFADAVAFEKRFQTERAKTKDIRGVPYLHDSRKPLEDVIFQLTHQQPELFGNECEGMCGV